MTDHEPDEQQLLDTLLRLSGQPVPERPEPEPTPTPPPPDLARRPRSPRKGTAVASPKQVEFLRKLIAERDGFDHVASGLDSGLSRSEASALIEQLMNAPRRPQQVAELGYYAKDGKFYTVVKSRGSDKRYAKVLHVREATWDMQHGQTPKTVKWEYTPGMVMDLTEADKLTLDEAKAFGHLHGHCIICCRELHDPKSVEAGIGPDCQKTLNNQGDKIR
jgi:hypothetical protein